MKRIKQLSLIAVISLFGFLAISCEKKQVPKEEVRKEQGQEQKEGQKLKMLAYKTSLSKGDQDSSDNTFIATLRLNYHQRWGKAVLKVCFDNFEGDPESRFLAECIIEGDKLIIRKIEGLPKSILYQSKCLGVVDSNIEFEAPTEKLTYDLYFDLSEEYYLQAEMKKIYSLGKISFHSNSEHIFKVYKYSPNDGIKEFYLKD